MLTLAVIGDPIAHSLSPAMHRAGLAALGTEGAYLAHPVRADGLGDAVRGMDALGYAGFNVTVPHKVAVMPHLTSVDAVAQRIGAVNTVFRGERGFEGTNTDAAGYLRALEGAGVQAAGRRVALVGAGGAARAVAVGLLDAGAASVHIFARRKEAAATLATEIAAGLTNTPERVKGFDLEALDAKHGSQTDLLVQATSATLNTHPGSELAARLPIDAMPSGAVVSELVYRPRMTPVLERAQAAGLVTVDGLGMLLHQGVIALERWTGQPAPVATMRAALEEALTP